MKRWLAFLLLIASCSGCSLMEDMVYGPEYEHAAPVSSCGAPSPSHIAQTQEPELIQIRN